MTGCMDDPIVETNNGEVEAEAIVVLRGSFVSRSQAMGVCAQLEEDYENHYHWKLVSASYNVGRMPDDTESDS